MKLNPDEINTELNELLRWRVPRQGDIEFDGESYSPNWIIERLKPLVTAERLQTLEQVAARRSWDVATICDGLYDIGNISAVMRSSESFGFLEFKILERKDASYKKSDRVSRGSEKWLDIERSADCDELVQRQKKLGRKILVTCLEGGRPIDDVDLSKPLCLVFGNEKDGVRSELMAAAEERVTLPMLGFTESFNISVAAALCYQRVFLARQNSKTQNPSLTKEEYQRILATYILRSVGNLDRVSAILKVAKARD